MPFVKRVVHPSFLSRKPLDKRIIRDESEAVNNNTLVEVLKQLACLTRFAEDVFQDLVLEANILHCRTDKLKARIIKVDATVSALDAKAVIVPVGDLDKFFRIKEHFVAPQHHDHGLFKSQSRPRFVQKLYQGAVLSPVHIIREIDNHRQDGHRNSKIFMCLPFFRETKVGLDLDIETRRPSSMSTAPTWLQEEDQVVPYNCSEHVNTDKEMSVDTIRRLPSPEEVTYAMSLKFQYSDVPIDVTGTGFWRMASFRRSLIQRVEYLTKRKKKKGKRCSSLSGSYDQQGINEALQEAKLKKLRLKSGTQTCRARLGGSRDSSVQPKLSVEHKQVQTSDLSDSMACCSKDTWLDNRARFRASICGGNIYEEVDKLRRIRQLEDSEDDDGGGSVRMRSRTRSDMAVAVKMRDSLARSSTVKGGGDDGGQSSSGNWSASSSTRASLESDHARSPELMLPRTSSQTSLSKDSALSDGNTPPEDSRLTPGLDCRLEITANLNSPTRKSAKVGKDTARWLRSLQEETTDASTTGTITPLMGHRRALSPFDLPSIDDGESSEFSVDNDGYYTSMHTDSGLRPLPIAKAPLAQPVLRNAREVGGSNSTLSSAGVDTGSARSSYSGPPSASELKSSFRKKLPPPPPPPRRTSTLSSGNSTEISGTSSVMKGDHSDVHRKTSFSDSDMDVSGEKLLGKTAIDVGRIPSMCVVTPSPSDDEAGSTRSDRSSPSPPRTSASTGGSSTDGSSTSDPEKNNMCRAYSTLPKNFSSQPQPKTQAHPTDVKNTCSLERSASLNQRNQNANSWPRRPSNVLYKPETIVLYQNMRENKNKPNDKDRNASSMKTFFQPERPQPLSVELAERLSPVNPSPSLRLTPTPSSSAGNCNGRGARVVLDPLGHVIHCSSGTLARPSSGGSSPTGSISPTFPAPMNPITPSVPVQRSVPTIPYELPDRGLRSITGSSRYGGFPQPNAQHSVINGASRHQYDTNTLPRKRNSASSKPEPVFPENGDESYQAGTMPRRRTNFSFLRRDTVTPTTKMTSPAPVPGPLVSSAKTGAYVRLDGHPNHLVPNMMEAGKDQAASVPGTPPTPSHGSACTRPQSPWHLTDKSVSRLPSPRLPAGHIPSPTAMLASQALHAAACASRIPSSTTAISPSRPKSPSQIPAPVAQTASQRYKMGSPPRGPLASSFLQSSSVLSGNSAVHRLSNGGNVPAYSSTALRSPAISTSMTSMRGNVNNGIAVGPQQRTNPTVKTGEKPKSSEKVGSNEEKKSMTTEDLFAAIHQSKKKFDIKLEPESSLPSPPSSRSESPATSTPTKTSGTTWWGTVPRNGFLASKGPSEPIAGDRRSWSCDRSTPSPCTTPRCTTPTLGGLSAGDRKSWTSDRLGPTKQTSLRDFKMLLLQAGRSTPKAECSRPSALEMLKATAPTARRTPSTDSSPTTPKTPTTPTSALSNGYGYNSHHGPNRQGNFTARHGRCRTPLSMIHNTSEILSSTIPEDCSEESDGSSSAETPPPVASSTPNGSPSVSKPKNLTSRFSAVSVLQGLRSSRLPTSTAV